MRVAACMDCSVWGCVRVSVWDGCGVRVRGLRRVEVCLVSGFEVGVRWIVMCGGSGVPELQCMGVALFGGCGV